MSIPAWEILNYCVTQAQDGTKIDLTGEGDQIGIADDAIIPVMTGYRRDEKPTLAISTRPALLFVAPRTVRTPASAGDNTKAWRLYTVLAQILDTDVSTFSADKVQARMKWENSIAMYFHMGNLRNAVFDTTSGMVTNCYVENVDTFDERVWPIFNDCVCIVPITFKCLQPHDTDGRV